MANTDAEALRRRDEGFAARIKCRDRSVLAEIDRAFAPALYLLLTKCVGSRFSKEDIDEVIQDTFVDLWGKFDAEKGASISSYVFQKARFIAISNLRNAYRRPVSEKLGPEIPSRKDRPDLSMEAQELSEQEQVILEHVDQIVETLSDRQRKAFQGRFWSGEAQWARKLQKETGVSSRLWSKAAVDAIKIVEKELSARGIRYNQEEGQYEVA